ncbi:ATP-binding protein [Metallosphaera hakonensis]|nr:DUF87 domain-containing protein [Metallosphaera hakonensis]
MKRRPNLRILAISTVIGVVVYFLTGSALIVAGVVVDSILLSFLDRTGLSLLSALSWISLPYLIMADPGSQETGLCIGRVEKVLARSLIPGFFQSGYRYKWFSVERPFCIELDKLKNFNTVILGSSGYGKSSLAKLILSKLDVDYIVFDLHGEYTDLKGKRIDVASNGINPLSLFGRSPKQRSIEISMMLKSIFNLGNIQTMDLSNLIIEGYQEKGIYDEDERSWILSPPTFRDLILLLERKKRASLNSADLSRWGSIEPYLRFLDSNVFNGSEDISKIIEGKTILDFSRISISNIKYVLMETILTSILGTMYTQKYGSLRRLVVIDEAPFLLEKESGEIMAERLFAEGRKFGYGFVMISQYSSKLEKMINNASLVMVMGMKEPNEVNYISRLLGDRSYESERVIYETVTGLERGMIMTRDITVNDIIVVRLHQG